MPQELQQRGFATKEEMGKITEWKMLRGQWRPRNLQLVLSNSEKDVKDLSKAAFSLISEKKDLADPIKKLAKAKKQIFV